MHVAEKKAMTLKLPIYISHYSRLINSFACEKEKKGLTLTKKARNRKRKIGNRTEHRKQNKKRKTQNVTATRRLHKTGNRKTKN